MWKLGISEPPILHVTKLPVISVHISSIEYMYMCCKKQNKHKITIMGKTTNNFDFLTWFVSLWYVSFLLHIKYLTEQFQLHHDYLDGPEVFLNIHKKCKNRSSKKTKKNVAINLLTSIFSKVTFYCHILLLRHYCKIGNKFRSLNLFHQ